MSLHGFCDRMFQNLGYLILFHEIRSLPEVHLQMKQVNMHTRCGQIISRLFSLFLSQLIYIVFSAFQLEVAPL